MPNLLVINSSSAGEQSVSRQLVAAAVATVQRADPGVAVVRRELGDDPVPHLVRDTLAGVRGVASTPAEHAARALSDTLIAELRAADTVIIGAPMYNFSLPTTLRAWLDHVIRAGETFSYSEAGPKGLLEGKRVIVIESRGGLYSEGPGQIADFQEPYLRHLLGFIGLTDVTFVHAEKIGFGPEARAAAIEGAEARLAEILGKGLVAA
ncbi:FMN-dependent NADH-azoreductase [Phenylobacterium sp.]|jgi:FMN-dependent NADH-azoreductase|uniref:FMN-dependent NADH-azoreductase n=1 Tax=Phenylobacterium sp. TaxID=1871053 RepID=UPI000C994CA9|nr:FMN-dependent NADH-azoreductase [Phenylobacterium sp.]MAK80712.1 FMN-dependent NADH-azoreductase [Phenylobacterium sp.]|tara:strand:+ start:18218 stop:18841 length:624 start_codon:yes stop_codon:yes gene_type:complete